MCGICGVVHADMAHDLEPKLVHHMTDAIVHRGPDDDGYFVDGAVGLGMRRLSIIDIDGGRQPISNEDRSVWLVYNGEIYNYRDLRRELQGAGHAFSTHSDTEVVVHAYERDGSDCLQCLRGMFGLALWDARRRSLLLAVDRFGIKPLYYAADAKGIAFGSELKCVLRSGMIKRDLDLEALAQYFTFSYIPPPATIFAGVRKLGPGSMVRWSPEHGAEVRQYWEPRGDRVATSHTAQTGAELGSQLRAVLADAVRSHLVSDVPVGAFLSGGIDSSGLVALMSEAGTRPVPTFSIGFADRQHNELGRARMVAQRYGTEHHELVVEPQSVELLPTLVTHFDEPFADSSALPTYHVSRLAREHVKVVVSGDGGDELFLGYTLFRGLKLARNAQVLPEPLRQALTKLPNYLPSSRKAARNDRLALLLKRVADTMLPPEFAFKQKISAPGLEAVRPFLSPELSTRLAQHNPFAIVDHWLAQYALGAGRHPLESFVYTGFQTSLAGDMLVKVDRMSMANSLEVRVPFLDHVLAEYVATIPIARRMPRWRLKGLLKDVLADALPAEIRNAPKRGFTVPLSTWFRGDLVGYTRDVLITPEVTERGLLDAGAIEKMLARHRQGERNFGSVIWVLLMFELWCREVLD